MTWVKLDDGFFAHPKVVDLSKDAKLLYLAGLAYCSANLTDGVIARGAVRIVGALADVPTDAAGQELAAAGLWEPAGGGYQVHDYLDYQLSAQTVKAEREMSAMRKSLYADPFTVERVKKRDQNQCRYCGRRVQWTDRKGPGGGTLDHVIPRGGNHGDNIVVACRACNSRKGRRTPAEAGLALLPIAGAESSNGTSSDLGQISASSVQDVDPIPGRSPVDVDPGEVATAVATMAAAPSDKARQVIEWWRVAHGKPRPPKLNPAQLRTLEDAIPDLGLERLHEAVEWSAQNGVPEFIKCVRGAYTKRQRDEQPEGDTGHGVAGQRAARGPEPRPHGRAAGEPRRVSAFAKYR